MSNSISSFLKRFPRIYCLSLPQSGERRAYIRAFAKEYELDNLEFQDAASPDSQDVVALYQQKKVKTFPNCFRCGNLECGDDNCNNTLIPVQVATFASYLRVLNTFLQSGLKYALFIEDDIKLVEQASVHCASLEGNSWLTDSGLLESSAAMIQLGWAYASEHESETPAKLGEFQGKMSNPAFALNRAMAKLIIDEFSKVSTTVDIFIHNQCATSMNAKTVYPPLFYEMSWSTGEVESTIHPKEVRLSYLESTTSDETLIANARAKLASHKKHTDVYPLLIVGHPRCGSGYSAKLANETGIRIGHEELLADGISSWMFATNDDCPWALNDGAKNRRFKHFKCVAMHVRDPRKAIPSIMRDNVHAPASYGFRRKHILKNFSIDLDSLKDNFTRAVASYVYWNKLILDQKPNVIFRVEDEAEKFLNVVSNHLDVTLPTVVNYPDNKVNADKKYNGETVSKPEISEENFNRLPVQLTNELNTLCKSFGYQEFKNMHEFNKQSFLQDLENLTLRPTGWIRSAKEQVSVDDKGNPMPWWTLPSIEFVSSVLNKHWRVFEYGCGHSTLWWQERVAQVIGVDHDPNWVEKVSSSLNSPSHLYFKSSESQSSERAKAKAKTYFDRAHKTEFEYDDVKVTRRGLNDADFIDYADTINQAGGKFDCIVIDGMARRLCAHFAVTSLADKGIIIFDNSNRSDYLEGYQYLIEQGFYQIRMSGPVAGAPFPSCTSIFIRSLDSLPKVVFEPPMFGIPEY